MTKEDMLRAFEERRAANLKNKFWWCPYCGTYLLQSAAVCKECQKMIDAGVQPPKIWRD